MPDLGTRVLAICYSADRAEATFAVVIDENGFFKLYYFNVILKRNGD